MRCCPPPDFALDRQQSEPNDVSAADPPPIFAPPLLADPAPLPPPAGATAGKRTARADTSAARP